MKLNPKKCSFGVEEGPFLGHLITKQGIKVNPSKVKAITDLKLLKTLKEMQNLNKKLAALRKFLLKGSGKSLPFLKALESCTARPEKSGRIAKWAVELGEHDIEFKGRSSVKGQILADFLAKTPSAENKDTETKKL
ncbi:hypothetical protein Tco_0909740 [Tanacetum coccineum]|uniref:Reverse transcriptase n=1 Tax=Tanacetum coccineum TaxID=301880 RepID=A0ABQ5CR12_9ASTR